MLTTHRHRTLTRTAAAGILSLSALGMTACSTDTAGPETGTDVEDVQEEQVVEDAATDDTATDDTAPGQTEAEEMSAEHAGVEPYDGPYDAAFAGEAQSYAGQEVTLSADVDQVVSPSSFTIAGTEDTTVEALLVVSATEVSGLQPDLAVAVTGTVHQAFDLPAVEEELGVDLDDALYEEWDGEPYLTATNVDTSVASDQ